MKYIVRSASGAFDLTAYESYLATEREALSALIQGPDLLALHRFVPTGPESFHDARFERLLVRATPKEDNGSVTQPSRLELRLKGPYFDRYFELQYESIVSCRVELPGSEDDLLMHELRLDDGIIVHELQFDKDKLIVIACRTICFEERPNAAAR